MFKRGDYLERRIGDKVESGLYVGTVVMLNGQPWAVVQDPSGPIFMGHERGWDLPIRPAEEISHGTKEGLQPRQGRVHRS